jgi:hypothetical protein
MKCDRNRRPRGLTLATALLMLLTSLLTLNSRLVVAQQAGDIYAAADMRTAGASEGPPPLGMPSGTATFAHLASGGTRVTVTVLGLPPNSKHANHIHDGSCTGSILLPLQLLEADASGNANTVTDIDEQVDFARWYVNVHESATLPSPGIICGKVTPALAGAPPPGLPPASTPTEVVGLPGMPPTGQGEQFGSLTLVIVGIVGAIFLTAAGIHLRRVGKKS